MMKRMIAIALSMALVLGAFGSIHVFATGIPTMTVESVSGEVGQTVSVNVVLKNNPGFSSASVEASYDETRLTLVSATIGSSFSTGAFVNYNLPYVTFVRSNNVAEDGILLTLSFTIKSADGDGNVTIKYADGDITDIDENDVTFQVEAGTIRVECSHTAKTEVPSKSADCVHSGNHLYYTCDSCGAVIKADGITETTVEAETIPALGHDLSAATCTEAAKCQREGCGYVEGSALGHSFTNYVSNGNASCTEDGTKTAKCDRCDVTDTITDAGSAKGHNFAAAPCTTPKICKACGVTEGEALGHSYASTWSKGEDGHWHECTACGDKTDFAAHDYGTAGDKCIICDYERVHVHKLTLIPTKDATCTEDGNKAYYTCSDCENWFEDASGAVVISDKSAVVLGALGHDYADATCTTPQTCKICGATEGEALGHSYASTWSKGEDGHWHECTVCGDKTDFASHDYGTAGDNCAICEYEWVHVHRLTLVPARDATCTEDGSKAHYICSGCEDWFEDAFGTAAIADKTSVVIPAMGHDMLGATCTEAAHCQRDSCDYTEGFALGHIDANTDGKCDRCGITIEVDHPTTPDKPMNDVPKTGDNSNTMLWAALLVLSLTGMMICAELCRKRNAA